jgi:hypothetical protein
MGKRIIISESEKKNILSLYEQDSNEFKKENDFLKRYVGKTFNEYSDKQLQKLWGTPTISSIEYDSDGLSINYREWVNNTNDRYSLYTCNYNPSKIGYKGSTNLITSSEIYDVYNKTLIDDINQKGTASGIKWCQKPKADFGVKSVNEDIKSTPPPPSESVFVANKNPFKYPEYESARREYKSNLQNGDMFYVDNGYRDYYSKKNDEFWYNEISNLSNKLKGKTIKFYDEIYEITGVKRKFNMFSTVEDMDDKLIGEITIILKNIENNNYSNITFLSRNLSDINHSDILKIKSGEKYLPSILNLQKFIYEELNPKDFNLPYESIPDEYFEIRKIQRQKTDF